MYGNLYDFCFAASFTLAKPASAKLQTGLNLKISEAKPTLAICKPLDLRVNHIIEGNVYQFLATLFETPKDEKHIGITGKLL